MTNKPDSQPTEETEAQRRERLARVHAVHTLNNTSVELFLCMRIPTGTLVPDNAAIISSRQHLPVADFDASSAAELLKLMLMTMSSEAIEVLQQQMDKFMKEQAGDGDAQVEDGPVHE